MGSVKAQMMKAPEGRVTIRDVARTAGVGVGTVSRVLNGANAVSAGTRKRVRAVIRRLRFRPNAHARRVMRARADTICFVLCNRQFLHPFHARIFQGVESAATALKQYVTYVAVSYRKGQSSQQITLPPILEEKGMADGLILAGAFYPNFIRLVKGLGLPFVASSNNLPLPRGEGSFDQVRYNGAEGQFQATRYLVEQGHCLIAFVGDTTLPWIREQRQGYLSAMRSFHLEPIEVTAHRNNSPSEYGIWAGSQLLSLGSRPTVVLAGSDAVAFGLWRSFRHHSLHVPGDISLVGFDDTEEALLVDPPLTTVRVPKEAIGQACVELLMQREIHPGDPFICRLLPTELIIRGTVHRL